MLFINDEIFSFISIVQPTNVLVTFEFDLLYLFTGIQKQDPSCGGIDLKQLTQVVTILEK